MIKDTKSLEKDLHALLSIRIKNLISRLLIEQQFYFNYKLES